MDDSLSVYSGNKTIDKAIELEKRVMAYTVPDAEYIPPEQQKVLPPHVETIDLEVVVRGKVIQNWAQKAANWMRKQTSGETYPVGTYLAFSAAVSVLIQTVYFIANAGQIDIATAGTIAAGTTIAVGIPTEIFNLHARRKNRYA